MNSLTYSSPYTHQRECLQPTALSWPILNVGKYFKNIFKGVASISVKCVILWFTVGTVRVWGFHFIFVFVSICSELVIVSGMVTFSYFFHIFSNTAEPKSFWNNRWPCKGPIVRPEKG